MEFTREELRWIKELVENEIFRRKQNGEVFSYDDEIFKNILNKLNKTE